MTAKQGRVNIVFEAEQDLKYRLTATLVTEVPDPVISSVTVLETNDFAGGFIFNQAEMIEGTYVNVKIEKAPRDNDTDDNWVPVDSEINIFTRPGANYTHLIRFDGEGTSEAGFGLTFNPITEESSSTLVDY